MRRWKRFWRLRKQNDTVKMMLLYLVIGACFLVNVIYNGVLLYRFLQSPIEYVLAGNASGGVPGAKLREIAELENVKAFSMQGEMEVTMKYQTAEEISCSCICLSKEYLKLAYGIVESGATKTFYANRAAYEQLKRGSDYEGNGEENIARVTYTIEALEEAEEGRKGSANVVLLTDIRADGEPVMFCGGDSVDYGKSTLVRVLAKKREMDQKTANSLQRTGFTVENTGELQKDAYVQELKLVRMSYGLAVAAVCFVGAWVMWRSVDLCS